MYSIQDIKELIKTVIDLGSTKITQVTFNQIVLTYKNERLGKYLHLILTSKEDGEHTLHILENPETRNGLFHKIPIIHPHEPKLLLSSEEYRELFGLIKLKQEDIKTSQEQEKFKYFIDLLS